MSIKTRREQEGWRTPNQVAAAANISTATVYRSIRAGELDAIRVGPKLLVVSEENMTEYVSLRRREVSA